MHSGTLERAGSPRKRTLSRGVSEDESLRNIIKEAESTRRLTRSDSRGGTLKRRSDSQHSEHDLFSSLPEMVELQESYDEVVQELRGLEVQREVLIFQVDVLQDALEETEELLAESQREASQANSELEREREAKKKLEDMINSLMQDVKKLKEERDAILVREQERGSEMTIKQAHQMKRDSEARGHIGEEEEERAEEERAEENPLNVIPNETQNSGASLGTNTIPFRSAHLGSSVDYEDDVDGEMADEQASTLNKIKKTCMEMATLALNNQFVQERSQAEKGQDLSPDGNNDTDSSYEDASAHTPEFDNVFSGSSVDGSNLPDNGSEPLDPKGPDSCILS